MLTTRFDQAALVGDLGGECEQRQREKCEEQEAKEEKKKKKNRRVKIHVRRWGRDPQGEMRGGEKAPVANLLREYDVIYGGYYTEGQINGGY